jgi:MazG family protein
MVRDLRNRCSWDRVQTRDTLRPYLIEEVHELDRALAAGLASAIRNELADLLLHLAWQLVLGEELGEFTPDDVAGDLEAKMKRRHPHLFDLGPSERWEALKRKERTGGVLEGLPPSLPDLLMAYRLQERAAGVGFDWPDSMGPAAKVREELAEVEAETAADRLDHEVGDLLFSVVNLARKVGVHPGPALDRANARFTERFRIVERLAVERGIEMHAAGLEVLDGLWNEAKLSP